jgi:hypothetical protein
MLSVDCKKNPKSASSQIKSVAIINQQFMAIATRLTEREKKFKNRGSIVEVLGTEAFERSSVCEHDTGSEDAHVHAGARWQVEDG